MIRFVGLWCCFLIFCVYSVDCSNDCVLEIPPKNAPLYTANFGSKRIVIPLTTSNLLLSEGETITGYCSSSFLKETNDNYNKYATVINAQTLSITCHEQSFNLISSDSSYNSDRLEKSETLLCSKSTFAFYEITHQFSNCEEFTSYALGIKTETKPFIFAGICYDLDNFSLKYVNYVVKIKSLLVENQKNTYPDELEEDSLLDPLQANVNNILSFANNVQFQIGYSNVVASHFWLKFAKYEYQPLVQSKYFTTEPNEFSKLFDIIWWENLRLGNWKIFIDLLDSRADEMVYSVYAGTSGAVQVPNRKNSNETLVVDVNCSFCFGSKFDRRRHKIPEYIWTYLRLRGNSSTNERDFVLIGYNSPYFGYFNRSQTIFCKDMCNEIDWLEPMKDKRMISIFGIVFCCRPEDVQNRLSGFPKNHNLQKVSRHLDDIPTFRNNPRNYQEGPEDSDEYDDIDSANKVSS